MNILLLGSGGRESAIAWKLNQSQHITKLYIAPGNGGTWQYGENISIDISDFDTIKKTCLDLHIDMIICGPEQPAVDGIWDYFSSNDQTKSIYIVSPSKEGARLEGEKSYAKEFMLRHHIPTADYIEVTENHLDKAYQWFETRKPPYVIKADGLAAGKGVVLPETKELARQQLDEFILDKKFGESSSKVVIEEFIKGIEFSIFVYTNGNQYAILPNAKDYKRRYEGDQGLNTGGMGCISPVPFLTKEILSKVEQDIIRPTVKGLQKEQISYIGFIYFGLIMTDDHQVKVIEYNCRLGDPEAEVILPRMEADIIDLIMSGKENTLDGFNIKESAHNAATVIAVSEGYPESYEKGYPIVGLENVTLSTVFHAGTKLEEHELKTSGGRVLAITSLGETLKKALEKSYNSMDRIKYEGKQYRKDIGYEFL